MKKIIITLACLTFINVAAQAQSKENVNKEGARKTENTQVVNPDGTIQVKPTEVVTPEAKDTKGNGTRMAINQKGVPASKNVAKEEKPKEEKVITPKKQAEK